MTVTSVTAVMRSPSGPAKSKALDDGLSDTLPREPLPWRLWELGLRGRDQLRKLSERWI